MHLTIISENVHTNNKEIENNIEAVNDGDSEVAEDDTKSFSLHEMLKGIIECENEVWKCKVCGEISQSQVTAGILLTTLILS